jgi:hypothetical protein
VRLSAAAMLDVVRLDWAPWAVAAATMRDRVTISASRRWQ